jgi:hypothetical protein
LEYGVDGSLWVGGWRGEDEGVVGGYGISCAKAIILGYSTKLRYKEENFFEAMYVSKVGILLHQQSHLLGTYWWPGPARMPVFSYEESSLCNVQERILTMLFASLADMCAT